MTSKTPTIKVVIKTKDGRESCACGCGEFPAGKKSQFLMGHDMRLRGVLTRAHLQGQQVEWKVGKAAPVMTPALDRAGWFKWDNELAEAARLVAVKCAELVKKAKKNSRLEKVGATEEYPVMAVYRNANGSTDVEFIDKLGKKHWKHLKAKAPAKAAK